MTVDTKALILITVALVLLWVGVLIAAQVEKGI
jgi:hypothetical protein